MYLLAVDPGVQTGVALLTGEGTIVWTLTSEHPYDELRSALRQYPDAVLTAEAAPKTRHYQDVHSQVSDCFAGRRVHWIQPSQWKNNPACQVSEDESSGFETKHEAEAVSIGRCHLQIRSKSEPHPAGADA